MGIQQFKVSFTASLIILILFFSCHLETPIHKIDINKQLDVAAKTALQSHSPVTQFPLCDLLPIKDWDSVIVIGPYSNETSFEGISIQNFNAVKNSLLSASLSDWACTLAYVKNQNVFAFSTIHRTPVDFCMYNKNVYIIKRSACNLIGLKNQATVYGLS